MELYTDTEQQLCINGWSIVDALEGAGRDTYAVGQPLVVVTLPTQLLAD